MDIEGKSSHTWVRLGPVYGAVVGDALAAIVYHADARRGVTGGPGGNGSVSEAAWYLVWVHEPHRHFQLASPPRAKDMTSEQMEEAAFLVLSEAGKIIDEKVSKDNS